MTCGRKGNGKRTRKRQIDGGRTMKRKKIKVNKKMLREKGERKMKNEK